MEISIIKIRRSWDCLIFVMEIDILVRGYLHIETTPWGLSQLRCHLTSLGIPMLKIRRSHDRLIFNMEISIPGKDSLYIETVPWSVCSTQMKTIGTCWPCSMMPYSIAWPQWVKSVTKLFAALPELDGVKILAVHMHVMHILITYVVGLTIIRNISSNKVHPTSQQISIITTTPLLIEIKTKHNRTQHILWVKMHLLYLTLQ